MGATKVTRTIKLYDLGTVANRVDDMNTRIAKRNLGSPVTLTVGDTYIATEMSPPFADTTFVEVTMGFFPVVLPGGYTLSAIADYSSTETALVFDMADTGLTASDFDRTRCDHCATARKRNRVFAVTAADGTIKFVGSTCVKDFLGVDPAGLLWVAETIDSVFDEDGFGGGPSRDSLIPTSAFVSCAQSLIATGGYIKASDPGSTRDSVLKFFSDPNHAAFADAADALQDPATKAFAAEAIAWAAGSIPDDTTSDFDRNLFAVATSEMIGPKAFGLAAYLPVAYSRHLDYLATKAAEAEAAGPVEDVPTGRVVVTGTIVSTKIVESQWGTAYKMVVLDDRGFRIYVTQPTSISDAGRGDSVSFTATLVPSDDDATFGFGSRPSKASMLVAA
jgi:hypothetical protein